jgi:multiple sugar transport system substrate-binding protein
MLLIRKRKLMGASLASVMMGSLLLSACTQNNGEPTNVQTSGNKQETGNKVTVSWWETAAVPQNEPAFKGVAKAFEEQNPDITIEFLGIPDNSNEKARVALAAGSPPNILNKTDTIIPSLGPQALEPLDDYLEKSPLKGKFSEESLKLIRDMTPTGKLYALPAFALRDQMFARADLFKAKNVKIPTTWDEFFDAAVKLTDSSKGQYGLSIRGGAASVAFLERLMYGYSGITEILTKDGKTTINDPLHVEFVSKYLGLYKKATAEEDITKGFTEVRASFQSGSAAMYLHNTDSGVQNDIYFKGDRSKFEAFPIPKSVKGYYNLAPANPFLYSIFKDAPNKAEAWKFLEYFTSKEANSIMSKTYSAFPENIDSSKDAWIDGMPWMVSMRDTIKATGTKTYEVPSYLPEYATIRTQMEPEMQSAMLGKITAKQFLDDWAARVEKAKADYDARKK